MLYDPAVATKQEPQTEDLEQITADQCSLVRATSGWFKGQLILTLPLLVDMSRIQPEEDMEKFGNSHLNYANQYGVLAVGCDTVGRFFVPRELISPFPLVTPYGFRTTHSLTCCQMKELVYDKVVGDGRILEGEGDVIRLAMQNPLMSTFIQALVNWTNELGRIHGKEHLYEATSWTQY